MNLTAYIIPSLKPDSIICLETDKHNYSRENILTEHCDLGSGHINCHLGGLVAQKMIK